MKPTAALSALPDPCTSERPSAWASLCCLGLMLVVPFQVWIKKPPVPSFHAESIAVVLGLLAMTLALFPARGLRLPRATLLPLGFVAVLLLQMASGKLAFAQQGLLAALYLLWGAGLVVLAVWLNRVLGFAAVSGVLAACLASGALLSALIGLAQYHERYGIFARFIVVSSKHRIWGNLAQPNHLSDYLALGLASLSFLFAVQRLRAWLAFPLALLLIHVLVLTGSRAVVLYLAVFLALAALSYLRDRQASSARLLTIASSGLAAFFLLPGLLRWAFPGAIPDGISSVDRLSSTSFSAEQRFGLWHAAWRMFLDGPILGQGFRQFGYRYFLTGSELPALHVAGFNDNAHNMLLQVGAEFGVVGSAVLLAGIVLWIRSMLRRPLDPCAWWLWSLAGVLVIHSLLEYPLWYGFFLGIAALLLGLAERRRLEPEPMRVARPAVSLAAWTLAAFGWLVWSQLLHDYRILEEFPGFRERHVTVVDLHDPHTGESLQNLYRTSLLAPFAELALARTIRLDAADLAGKIALNGHAMKVFPVDDVVYRQAILLALNGDAVEAVRQWDLAVMAFPRYQREASAALTALARNDVAELAPLLQHVRRFYSAAAPQPTSKD